MNCLIAGDSIAVGISNYRKDCAVYAKSGISSGDYNKKYYSVDLCADVVVISLGSNDMKGVDTFKNLSSLRSQVDCANRVLWVMPLIDKPRVHDAVRRIAENYGDDIVYFKESGDGVHPSGRAYREIASAFPK